MIWIFLTPLHSWAILLHSVIISDYISLFVIRHWLDRLGHRLLTGLIGATLIGIVIVISTMGSCAMVECLLAGCTTSQSWMAAKMNWWEYFDSRSFIVAFIVYAWLILFALGALMLRALNTLLGALRLAQWFHGRGHPLRAIGYVAASVVFVVTAVSQGALSIFQLVLE